MHHIAPRTAYQFHTRPLWMRLLAGAFFAFLTIITAPDAALAAVYETQMVSKSPEIVRMDPGGTATVTVMFKNTGSATWTSYAKDYVSVYTYEPKYRVSTFRDANWVGVAQPVRMQESVIGPGNTATFRFTLTAPKTPGTYLEAFRLAVEDVSWIEGSDFKVTIAVADPGAKPAVSTPVPAVAPSAKYGTTLLSMTPSKVEVMPGAKATVTLKFRNDGSTSWTPRGAGFISLYTHGPKYRQSMFRDASWHNTTQPALISESVVATGGTATITFTFSAPAYAGEFKETFWLAAEDKAWIPGGEVTIPVLVRASASVTAPPASTTAPQAGADQVVISAGKPADGYKALMLLSSAKDLKLQEGATTTFRVAFKNTGKKSWTGSGDTAIALSADAGNAYSFRHSSWPATAIAARLTTDAVQPGQLAFFDVTLAAPSGTGSYVPRFVLAAGNQPVEGGTIELPVEVTRGAVSASIPSFSGAPAPSGPRGPNIRVGLFKTASTVVVGSSGAYSLVEGRDHTVVRPLAGITTITFDAATLRYTVRNGSYEQTFEHHVHLRPDDMANNIFEIQSYSNVPVWDTSLNFNKFRGELEVFYSAAVGETWVIEELPLEDYMRGLAETSNGSHFEFQKALVTAARTFAYFVQKTGGKHAIRHFDVTTGDGDQVYKGYASELVRPNVVRAVEETRGMMVTLDGDIASTPYFSRSDGRTRAFHEVWGGSVRSWLVSVPTPYDAGKSLWGHGVGMSASDALARAEAGANWQDILKYYYTGVTIAPRY